MLWRPAWGSSGVSPWPAVTVGQPSLWGLPFCYCNVTGAHREKREGASEASLPQPRLTPSSLRGLRTMGPWR